MFIPLHTHSTFSFHAGVCSVKQLVSRAKKLGFASLALTDTDRMSGLIQFYLECREQGIKPILGVELTEPGRPHEHIVLLARNAEGYGDICEIITQRHVDASRFSYAAVFAKPWPNLVLLTSFPNLLKLLVTTPNKERLYAELINNSDITRTRSREVEATARSLGIPLTASNNSFFLDPSDWETHQVLTAIGLNSTISRLKPHEYASERAYVRSTDNMMRLFPEHREALLNTQRIADQCNAELSLNQWILPRIEVPEGFTPRTFLEKLAAEGLEHHYAGTPAYDQARELQRMEIETIDKLGYPSYFLIVKDIRDWANNHFAGGHRKPKDCTILRGSAANSITFYNIGVSDLDPIRYDLYFQRFLNEDRASPPDADLDFGWDEREEALDYMVKRWGRDRVAITCTTNHFRRRAAFRETAKVFGYSEEQVTRLMGDRQTMSAHASDQAGRGSGLPDPRDSELSQIVAMAERIRGKPRFLGQHPGGVLITNDAIWRRVACECSGDDRIITQIDMHNGIDELGVIKFDLLGNGSLSVLRDALAQLSEQHIEDPRVDDLEKCYADPDVRAIIRNGRTRGIFYIESPAQMRLNKKSQVETFEELTITSSLIRPAGASYTKTFIERHRKAKEGIRDWEYLHPSLASILGDTHDVCAFQEDVTKICHQIAGLSYKRADKIRKMMNSSHEGEVAFDVWEQTAQEFVDGCMSHTGLTREQAVELWARVSSFTGFSFCKSHSASYAQLSFKCSYLKSHFPAQFLSAVISNNHGFYTRDVYLDEARRWGVRILPIDINESRVAYWGKHSWIRPGFMHIRAVRRSSMDLIMQQRQDNGQFRNLPDFLRRVPLGRSEAEKLILVGAFDAFGLTRPESLFQLDGIYGTSDECAPSIFSDTDLSPQKTSHPGLHDYTFAQKCFYELELLGFMLSGNILDILELHPSAKGSVPAHRIGLFVGRRVKVFGWPITRRVHEVSGEGKPMMFITLQDKTECMDIVLRPEVYERHMDVVEESGPYEVWGTITEDWGTFNVNAESIRSVQWSPSQVDFELASQKLSRSFKEYQTYADVGITHTAAA